MMSSIMFIIISNTPAQPQNLIMDLTMMGGTNNGLNSIFTQITWFLDSLKVRCGFGKRWNCSRVRRVSSRKDRRDLLSSTKQSTESKLMTSHFSYIPMNSFSPWRKRTFWRTGKAHIKCSGNKPMWFIDQTAEELTKLSQSEAIFSNSWLLTDFLNFRSSIEVK